MHFRMILMTDTGSVEDVTSFIYPPPNTIQRGTGGRFPSLDAIMLHCHSIAAAENALEWELWRLEDKPKPFRKDQVMIAISKLINAGLRTSAGWIVRPDPRTPERSPWVATG